MVPTITPYPVASDGHGWHVAAWQPGPLRPGAQYSPATVPPMHAPLLVHVRMSLVILDSRQWPSVRFKFAKGLPPLMEGPSTCTNECACAHLGRMCVRKNSLAFLARADANLPALQ
eukprot:6955656-Prymnesium_polylepis.4